MSFQNNRNRVLGKFRIVLGECPRCNSDAPNLYDCPVCQFGKVPKEFLWANFLLWRSGKDFPSWRPFIRGRYEHLL